MRDYKDFQSKQSEFERDANEKYETLGVSIHWLFLLIGVVISAGASYYIGHRGLAGNPFYERFVGPHNAALLVVAALDGSFVGLLIGMATFFKTTTQRSIARKALTVIKIILVVNLLCTFLLVQSAGILPIISTYVVYGSPLVIGGTLWLWSSLFNHRRRNVMMASALDTVAQRDALWAEQYLQDQTRNRDAYNVMANSPAMAALRNEAARRKAIEDVAREFGLTFAEAEMIYLKAENERDGNAAGLLAATDEARRLAIRILADTQQKPRVAWQGGRVVEGSRGN